MGLFDALASGRLARFGPLVLRVPVGIHLIHGTQDNVFAWERMLEFRDFLAGAGFPLPLACAVTSVAAQFAAGVLYLVGFRTRLAAAIMTINFLVALFGVHVAQGHPYTATFPAIFMLASSLALLFAGPGAWSFDERMRRR